MPIIFACLCRRTLSAPAAAAGRWMRCEGCGARVRVPSASGPRDATAPGDEETARVGSDLSCVLVALGGIGVVVTIYLAARAYFDGILPRD